MKHFYAIAVAMATVFGASAATPLQELNTVVVPQKTKTISQVSDLFGNYEWSYYSYLSSDFCQKEGAWTISASAESDSKVQITGLYLDYPVTADVNLSEGTLSIPEQVVFHDDKVNKDVILWHNRWKGWDDEDLATPIVAQINKNTGEIVFDEDDNIMIGRKGIIKYLYASQNKVVSHDPNDDMKVEVDFCTDNNKFTFNFTFGSNIAKYKYEVLPGRRDNDFRTYEAVNEAVEASHPASETSVAYDADGLKRGQYSVSVAALNSDGAVISGGYAIFYVEHDDADQWRTLSGKAKYGEDFLASFFDVIDPVEYEVTIQENVNTKGFYRLVNPYDSNYPNSNYNKHTGTHNHYIYVHAEDPKRVYIEESSIGFDGTENEGVAFVSSLVYYYMVNYADEFNPESFAEYYGTLDEATKTITFPNKKLLCGEARFDNGDLYYANANNAFKLVLPEDAGVGDVIADADENAPVEYFNLQGQRIANPVAGQYVIRRQGGTVTKVIVK